MFDTNKAKIFCMYKGEIYRFACCDLISIVRLTYKISTHFISPLFISEDR